MSTFLGKSGQYLIFCSWIFGVWHIYQMEGLKVRCINVLKRGLDYKLKDVHAILKELESLSSPCEDLKVVCIEYLDANGDEVNAVSR